jgi:hypothetical protein
MENRQVKENLRKAAEIQAKSQAEARGERITDNQASARAAQVLSEAQQAGKKNEED